MERNETQGKENDRANEEECVIWNKIEKSGKVLFQPLEVAGTHIPHIFISHPALEWPTEAWNSQFLFPSNENIQGSPPCLYHSFTTSTTYFFHALTHTYTYTHIVLDLGNTDTHTQETYTNTHMKRTCAQDVR